jgi:hypothetical protein
MSIRVLMLSDSAHTLFIPTLLRVWLGAPMLLSSVC